MVIHPLYILIEKLAYETRNEIVKLGTAMMSRPYENVLAADISVECLPVIETYLVT